jgi:hypothetical protein
MECGQNKNEPFVKDKQLSKILYEDFVQLLPAP